MGGDTVGLKEHPYINGVSFICEFKFGFTRRMEGILCRITSTGCFWAYHQLQDYKTNVLTSSEMIRWLESSLADDYTKEEKEFYQGVIRAIEEEFCRGDFKKAQKKMLAVISKATEVSG